MEQFNKQLIALRFTLIGKGFFKAVEALEFAKLYHVGKRKGGGPEFQHQVEIALYILTLNIPNEVLEKLLIVAILHDCMEDYDIPHAVMIEKFGQEITDYVFTMAKVYMGVKKSPEFYFADILKSFITAIAKGADRVHNIQTMVGVFSIEKQKGYIAEVREYFLPMLKNARHSFPEYTYVFFNIEHMLKSQIELIEAMHSALGNQAC